MSWWLAMVHPVRTGSFLGSRPRPRSPTDCARTPPTGDVLQPKTRHSPTSICESLRGRLTRQFGTKETLRAPCLELCMTCITAASDFKRIRNNPASTSFAKSLRVSEMYSVALTARPGPAASMCVSVARQADGFESNVLSPSVQKRVPLLPCGMRCPGERAGSVGCDPSSAAVRSGVAPRRDLRTTAEQRRGTRKRNPFTRERTDGIVERSCARRQEMRRYTTITHARIIVFGDQY